MGNVSDKRYALNNDFVLVCRTICLRDGHKKYTIEVMVSNLPFEEPLEVFNSYSPEEANKAFKLFVQKYKDKKLFWM